MTMRKYIRRYERWKTIKDFPYYKISNRGRVLSLNYNKTKKEKILTNTIDYYGYYIVRLRRKGSTKKVHQLVAIAFLGHVQCGMKSVVNHKDFNKLNNHFRNLEIITQRKNANQKHIKSTSKYVGVHWNKTNNKWRALIRINGKQKHLGNFVNELDASESYQKALKNLLNESNN